MLPFLSGFQIKHYLTNVDVFSVTPFFYNKPFLCKPNFWKINFKQSYLTKNYIENFFLKIKSSVSLNVTAVLSSFCSIQVTYYHFKNKSKENFPAQRLQIFCSPLFIFPFRYLICYFRSHLKFTYIEGQLSILNSGVSLFLVSFHTFLLFISKLFWLSMEIRMLSSVKSKEFAAIYSKSSIMKGRVNYQLLHFGKTGTL